MSQMNEEGAENTQTNSFRSDTEVDTENAVDSSQQLEDNGSVMGVVDTEDMVLMLVERYEYLFNINHQQYRNNKLKESTWEEIARKVGITGMKFSSSFTNWFSTVH
jgi:hypothetical protein